MVNLFKILGLQPGVNTGEVKSAFYSRIKMLHPDTGNYQQDKFEEVLGAYRILKDPEKRKKHEKELVLFWAKKKLEGFSTLPPNRIIFPKSLHNIIRKIQIFDKKRYRKVSGDFNEDLCLLLTHQEAQLGIRFSVNLPLRRVCPECMGAGVDCSLCDGMHMITGSHPYQVILPGPLMHQQIKVISITKKPFSGAYFLTKKLKIRLWVQRQV